MGQLCIQVFPKNSFPSLFYLFFPTSGFLNHSKSNHAEGKLVLSQEFLFHRHCVLSFLWLPTSTSAFNIYLGCELTCVSSHHYFGLFLALQSLCLCLSVPVSVSVCLFSVSLSLCLSQSLLFQSLLCLSLAVSLSLCLSVSLCLCQFLPVSSLSFSDSSLSLSLPPFLYPLLSLAYLLFLSVSALLYCLRVTLPLSLSPSVSVSFFLCSPCSSSVLITLYLPSPGLNSLFLVCLVCF